MRSAGESLQRKPPTHFKSKQIGNEKLRLLGKMNFIWLKILSQKNFRAHESKQRVQRWVQRFCLVQGYV